MENIGENWSKIEIPALKPYLLKPYLLIVRKVNYPLNLKI
ncbi:hypothetical protein MmTuc01_0430 [Methanosarcina mazei Tuc01]|uniref:Uncharacterized protein n=1 Tax=Methanosarcina mazei Tuc01 TaxID=1236903 RepID=M1QFU3_METMZ|nr:hypothetical protein MmTuc01_0430 [Methanosarcina mazei Tuc01]